MRHQNNLLLSQKSQQILQIKSTFRALLAFSLEFTPFPQNLKMFLIHTVSGHSCMSFITDKDYYCETHKTVNIHTRNIHRMLLMLLWKPIRSEKPKLQTATVAVYDICRLQTADRRLQTADCRLETADCRLQTVNWMKPKIS